jgi:hypothetical protein
MPMDRDQAGEALLSSEAGRAACDALEAGGRPHSELRIVPFDSLSTFG